MINSSFFKSCAWLHSTMNTLPVDNYSPLLQSELSNLQRIGRGPAGQSLPLAFTLGSFSWVTRRILPLTEMIVCDALQKYHSSWPFHFLMKLCQGKEIILEKKCLIMKESGIFPLILSFLLLALLHPVIQQICDDVLLWWAIIGETDFVTSSNSLNSLTEFWWRIDWACERGNDFGKLVGNSVT